MNDLNKEMIYFEKVKELITEADAVSFYEKGNKAAGTRLRNAMQQLKGAGDRYTPGSNRKNERAIRKEYWAILKPIHRKIAKD